MLLLMLAALAQEPITSAEVSDGVSQIPEVRRALDRGLFDYPTARFRNVYVTVNGEIEGRRGAYLCGFVNSKNRMGAYVGWTAFVATEDFVETRGQGANILLDAMCGRDDPRDTIDRSDALAAD